MHELNHEQVGLPHGQPQAFYQVGGTLDWDAPSYLVRNADQALFEELRRGELCYVLDTRQVGKSSLLVRTAVRLLDQGIDIVQIDISKQGRNVTPESWYLGLLYQFTDQLSLWDTAEAFWESHASFSPVQRWFETIRQVVLIGRERPLVAFLDEIDAVRGLPFSADEFFASIRAVAQDQRSSSPSEPNPWRQLTFCFAGAATPAQLTSDVRATPFNIGTRIELTDFTEQDALPLAQGFSPADSVQRGALIARVVYWTGGHPYLTQRLCYEVAKAEATTPQQVDQLCRETFLDRKARETDPNLHFAHERILKDPENDPVELLRLYATIRKGVSVRYDPTSNLANTLRLAGLATISEGQLRVRNRIYAEQFNTAWVQESLRTLPDITQRKAYWQGFRRAALLGSVILLSTAAAIWFGMKAKQENQEKTRLTTRFRQEIKEQNLTRQKAEGDLRVITSQFTAKKTELAGKDQEIQTRQQALETLNKKQATTRSALTQAQNNLSEAQRRVKQERGQVSHLQARVQEATRKMEQLGQDEFKIIAKMKGKEKEALTLGIRTVGSLLDSGLTPEKETLESLAEVVNRGLVRLGHLKHDWRVTCVALSPDGKMAVTAGFSNQIWVWDIATGQCVQKITGFPNKLRPNEQYCTVVFSPSGDRVLTGAQDGVLRLWDVQGGRLSTKPHELTVEELAKDELGTMLFARFSPNGREIATVARLAKYKFAIFVMDAHTGKRRLQLSSPDSIWGISWSSDGKWIATANNLSPVDIWNAQTGERLPPLAFDDKKDSVLGKKDPVLATAIQFQGSDILLCGDREGRISAWYLREGQFQHTFDFTASKRTIWSLDSNAHGLLVAADNARHIRVLRLGSPENPVADLETHQGAVFEVRLVPSEHDVRDFVFASASEDQFVDIWHLAQNSYGTDQGAATHAAFSEDSLQFVMSDTGGLVRRRSVAPTLGGVGNELAIKENPGDAVTAIALSPNMKLIASGTSEGRLRLWHAGGQEPLIRKESQKALNRALTEGGGAIHGIAFSPGGEYLASVGRGVPSGEPGDREYLKLWSVATGKCLKVWPSPKTSQGEHLAPPEVAQWGYKFYTVEFTRDGKTLLCACEDGGVYVVDPQKDGFLRRLRPSNLRAGIQATDAYPSPNGHFVAASYNDGSILIWNLLTDQVVKTLNGHKGPATSVAISPDGKWLASAGNDGEILLWAMNKILQPSVQAQPYLRLVGHSGRIHSVRFDPDSQRVITASQDGTVRIFPVTPEEYLWEARAMMQYRPDRPYLRRPRKSDGQPHRRDEQPHKSDERK